MTDRVHNDITTLPPTLQQSGLPRARPGQPSFLGEVVPLAPPAAEAQMAKVERPASVRDWSSALELVQEASEAIRIGEERAKELEQHLAQVLSEANDEIRRLNLQIANGEERVAQAEQRAKLAETRATEAEAWLAKLHDAVVTAFAPVLRKEADELNATPEPATALQR